ncbi:hypothetical protein CG716_25110 [Mycolicibacterium sphagni]|uniref:Cobalt transporter n=2 Tax=Mycolicibacterium sphagni TaxID=1786 RepID=A0A255D7Y9_9MYCO|nr:hypothetical protein CG716_25110 [Mycolicibacterium sphagni]
METVMTAILTAPPSAPVAAPSAPDTATPAAIHIPALAWIAVVITLLWITYAFLGQDIAPNVWNHLHEFFHDGRHFLGIACH